MKTAASVESLVIYAPPAIQNGGNAKSQQSAKENISQLPLKTFSFFLLDMDHFGVDEYAAMHNINPWDSSLSQLAANGALKAAQGKMEWNDDNNNFQLPLSCYSSLMKPGVLIIPIPDVQQGTAGQPCKGF